MNYCDCLISLLLIHTMCTADTEKKNVARCGGGNISGADAESEGIQISVKHFALDPQIDIVPNISYNVEISLANETKVDAVQLEVLDSDLSQHNVTIFCSSLAVPIHAVWTPVIVSSNCVSISATVISMNRTFQTSLTLCKPKACRQYVPVTDSRQTIKSPNFPGKYLDNYNCTFVIYSDPSEPLHMQFQDFDLENAYENTCFDYVTLKIESNWTKLYCGNNGTYAMKDLHFVSLTGVMELEFITDNKIVGHGFRALIYTVPDCSYEVTHTSGTIKSPNFPNLYFPGMDCSVKIHLPRQYRIQARISVLQLENYDVGGNCLQRDYMEILSETDDGNISNKQVFCMNKSSYTDAQLVYQSCSSIVYVNFHTNSLLEGTGFLIKYTGYLSCSNQTFTSEIGKFHSENYPLNYLNNQDCFYFINVTGASKNKIQLTFDEFYTESVNDTFLEGHSCDSDFIELYRGYTYHRFCGKWIGGIESLVFFSDANCIFLRFVTNSQHTRSGFSARWKTIADIPTIDPNPIQIDYGQYLFQVVWKQRTWWESQTVCKRYGGFLAKISDLETQKKLEHHLLQGANFTMDLAFWIGGNDIDFEDDFYWTDGTRMLFKYWFPGWSEFDFANHQPSDDGYSGEDCVEIRRRFHLPTKGSGLADSYYWNDRNCNTRNPFICQSYKSGALPATTPTPVGCSRDIFLPYVNSTSAITSPNFPGNYPDFLDCVYMVTTPHPLYRIQISFEAFEMENSLGCIYDNFTFSAGFNLPSDSTECGVWKKKLKLLRWTSQTNQASFRFRSDNSVSHSGFKATLSVVTDPVCKIAMEMHTKNLRTWTDDQGCFFMFLDALPQSDAQKTCTSVNSSLLMAGNPTYDSNFSKLMAGFGVNITWFARNSSSDEPECQALQINSDCRRTTISCSKHIPFICRKTFPANDVQNDVIHLPISSDGRVKIPSNTSTYYENNEHRIYKLSSPPNTRIYIEIVEMDLEYQENCLYDFVRVTALNKTTESICGNSSDSYLSETNNITVEFHSDVSITGRGVTLMWKVINTARCIVSNSSYIWSLNYPFSYEDKLECCESFHGPENTRMQLSLRYANLEFSPVPLKILDRNFSFPLPTKCLSDDMTYLTSANSVVLCLNVPQIRKNGGFIAEYKYVAKDFVKIHRNVFVSPKTSKTGTLQSYNYPKPAPINHEQSVHFYTSFGYRIVFNITDFVTFKKDCRTAFLEMSERKYGIQKEEFTILRNFTCITQSSDSFVVTSNLNTLNVRFLVRSPRQRTFLYRAQYTLIKDDQYLTKTKYFHGGILDYCTNQTCLNGGICENRGRNLYSCQCRRNFTGLLCQTRWCDLNPCLHGKCQHSNDSYSCICKSGYWGRNCNFSLEECGLHYCSGHGYCAGEQSSPHCTCRSGWHGSLCSENGFAGDVMQDKLLKEPIWIGMIVVLNLVFAFTSLYIVRRRCEKRFQCCKDRKPSDFYQDKSQTRSPSEAATPSIYDIHKEYNFSSVSYPFSKTAAANTKLQTQEKTRKISGTESPNLCEENQLAAAKLFDSLKSEHLNELDSNGTVGGLVGGTLNFCPTPKEQDVDETMDREAKGLEHPLPVTESVCIEKPNKLFSSSLHCYPDIIIINSTPSPKYEDSGSIATDCALPMDKEASFEQMNAASDTSSYYDTLSAASKRKVFASKAKSAECSFNVDKVFDVRYSDDNEDFLRSHCRTKQLSNMKKCFSEENAYFKAHERTPEDKHQSLYQQKSYGGTPLYLNGHRVASRDIKHRTYDHNNKLRRKSVCRRYHSDVENWSLPSKPLSNSDYDSVNQGMEATRSKRRRRKSRHQREKSRRHPRSFLKSIDSEMEVIKTTVRKSRSNDLNTRAYNTYSSENANGMQMLDAKQLRLMMKRRHSYHITSGIPSAVFNPDDMLNEEQKISYQIGKENFPGVNIPDILHSDVSLEVPSSAGFLHNTLSVPFVSDTDTGFSSSSRSVFSSPWKDDFDSSVNATSKGRRDSAYQSNHTSLEVANVDVTAAIIRDDIFKVNNTDKYSRKDLKVYKRLEQAANKLRSLANESDAIEENTNEDNIYSSDDNSLDRDTKYYRGSKYPEDVITQEEHAVSILNPRQEQTCTTSNGIELQDFDV